MSKKQRHLPDKINFRATRPTSLEESSAIKGIPPPVFHLDSQAPQPLTPQAARQLQRQIGNRAVGRLFNQARPPVIQTKLQVGPANDKYEQEADQVAQQIMQTPRLAEATQARGVSTLQRVGGAGGFEAGREVESHIVAQRGSGQRLPANVRAQVEPRLGADFSGVRVHTDAEADALNQSLNARAFTTGRDIFFRRGEYQPESSVGQQLLAHELTHVTQQQPNTSVHIGLNNLGAASLQRAPALKMDESGTYVDDQLPGATLIKVADKSEMAVEYRIAETGVAFTFNTMDGKYYQGDREVQPKDLRNPTKRKERKENEDEYFSDFVSSEDDENITLDEEQKMKLLMKHGGEKQQVLKKKKVEKKEALFPLHDPHARKIYSSHRTDKDSTVSNINDQELIFIGNQTLRIGEGTGYFMQPGGNVRPKTIKEPPADYQELFEGLKKLGEDKNAKPLYRLSLGTKAEPTLEKTLTDEQVARMVFYYINNDAEEIEKQLTGRTQLTEHLSKLAGIFGISETSRSLEAINEKDESSPYDVTLLIKQGLVNVIEGSLSLEDVFYKGKGGEDSVFLGAPSEKHSSKQIGGADQLRKPFKHKQALNRQMGIFPKKKKELKQSLNKLKSQSNVNFPELNEEDQKKFKEKLAKQQVERAQALLDEINKIEVPTNIFQVDSFLRDKKGPIKKFTTRISALLKQLEGNEEAIKLVKKAIEMLRQKAQAANNVKVN